MKRKKNCKHILLKGHKKYNITLQSYKKGEGVSKTLLTLF